MKSWDQIDEKELNKRKRNAKRWDSLSDDEKTKTELATQAVRHSSKVGSKLEHYILQSLVKDGYNDFHKEQIYRIQSCKLIYSCLL